MSSGAQKLSGTVSWYFGHAWQSEWLQAIKKGAHVLVEGSLVRSTCGQPNGKSKKSKDGKITS